MQVSGSDTHNAILNVILIMSFHKMLLCACISKLRLMNTTDTVCSHPDLDNLVGARGEQIPSGGLIVHVNNAVLAVVEGGCGRSTRRHERNASYFTV